MNFLWIFLFFVLFLFNAYADRGSEEPRIEEINRRSCVKVPEGTEAVECSCDLTPPPEFREPDRVDSDGSSVRTSYPRMRALGIDSDRDEAEQDARETCIAAVRETLIDSGMSVTEADQYPNYSSHILACRPYVCNEK